jgi:hypothetical protein
MPCLAPTTDERTAQDVLQGSSHLELRGVECRVNEDRLELHGEVPSFYLKQLAQSLLMHRLGELRRVDNQLTVTRRPEAACRSLSN